MNVKTWGLVPLLFLLLIPLNYAIFDSTYIIKKASSNFTNITLNGTTIDDWEDVDTGIAVEVDPKALAAISGNASAWSTTYNASFVLRNTWTTIDSYPTACISGQFVRGIGDTLTCAVDSTYNASALQLSGGTLTGTINTSAGGVYGNGTQPFASNIYVQSRLQNLISNGNGMLLNNYNFGSMVFDPIETHGGSGSFKKNGSATVFNDEFIPVNPNNHYDISVWMKQGNDNGSEYNASSKHYAGVALFDIDKLPINPAMVLKSAAAVDTWLVADLNPGDTIVYLNNASGWYNGTNQYERQFTWWPYTNSLGYTYPNYTYSRNNSRDVCAQYVTYGCWNAGAIDYAANTITLRLPWAGPKINNGSAVRNAMDTGTYKYNLLGNQAVSNNWTEYRTFLSGTQTDLTYQHYNKFLPGTAYIKLLWLVNYASDGKNVLRISDVSIKEDVHKIFPYNAFIANSQMSFLNETGLQTSGFINLSNGQFTVMKDAVSPSPTVAQVIIKSNGAPNHMMTLGYQSSNGYGFMQAYEVGTGYRNINLNPLGGNVGIGSNNPTKKLQINGTLQADDYYSGDGTQGYTSAGTVYICTDATCTTKLACTIKDGLITGCV